MIPDKLTLRDGSWDSVRRALQVWIDGVQNVLTRGLRIGDQVGTVRVVRFNSDRTTPIAVTSTARTLAVVCLSASAVASPGEVVSMPRVSWSWLTQRDSALVVVSDVDGLTASTDYDLSILVLEG